MVAKSFDLKSGGSGNLMGKQRQIDHEVKMAEISGLEKLMNIKYNRVPQWERRLRTDSEKVTRPKSQYKLSETKVPKTDLSKEGPSQELENLPYGNLGLKVTVARPRTLMSQVVIP